MLHVCRRCSRINPPEAHFCFFDGIALDAQHRNGPVAAGAKAFPAPFVFATGRRGRNFDELLQACDSDWNAAQTLLKQGHFESFLGGLGRADLAMAARQAAKEADRERGLDQFLNKLPAGNREPAKLSVLPLEINLGQLTGERRFMLNLSNQGGGLLYGTVAADETNWLAFGDAPGTPRKLFQCRYDQEIAVHAGGKNLRAGNKPVEGRILVESNGGTALILVRAEKPVQPFPDGVLAGARLPREIAARAKAYPKEAAPLFEQGAVKGWYEANGWTYPVQGPSSSGLGGIQQFFEALGLVQPPKVQISHTRLQFQGKPGAFLEQLVRVQTLEKRPVFANAATTAPWLQIGRTILEGRTASIPIRVPSIPATPGERLQATVQVTSNGNQRFSVEVELAVAGAPASRHEAPVVDIGQALAAPVVAMSRSAPLTFQAGRAFTSSRPVPVVDQLEEITAKPRAATYSVAPARAVHGRMDGDEEIAPSALPLLSLLTPIIPILLLGFAVFVVLVHDLILPSQAPVTSPGDPTLNAPLLALRFHDGGKPGADGKDHMPDPTMRFGLLMRREEKNQFVALTNEDMESLKGRQPADLDRFKRLTFDDWGRSNNTCLKIDGGEFLFGDSPGKWLAREEPLAAGEQGLRSIWLWERAKIEVTQTVEIVRGEQSGRYDTCLIRYRIENQDTKPHTVGLRFLLDTYIGGNDGVPFTIPGDASLCETLKSFDSPDQVPDYIQALERPDLRNPGTVAHLQFRVGNKLESPTRVLLGGWPHQGLAELAPKDYPEAKDERTLWRVPLARWTCCIVKRS